MEIFVSSNFSNLHTFTDVASLTAGLAEEFLNYSQKGIPIHISLSGGSTPKVLFETLALPKWSESILWSNLHFWWGDERCVHPTDPQSNFGEAQRILFRNINLPPENIHRVMGEWNPDEASAKYTQEMADHILSNEDGSPVFDWILLGMGDDGHTASLFPQGISPELQEFTAVATHPTSGQKRVSKTLKVINAAQRISFLVTGSAKEHIFTGLKNNTEESKTWPAGWIKVNEKEPEWWLDAAAASFKG
jgi:6-phosphogluconolactonase